MSTLSSSSTLAEIKAAYDDNASYAEDGDTAKAAAFMTACRLLIRQTPKLSADGGRFGREIQIDVALVREELLDAQRWLSLQNTGGSVKRFDLSGFRN